MKIKSKIYTLVIVGFVIAIAAAAVIYAISFRPKKFDQFEVANQRFRIRVTAYHDTKSDALPGARFVFQSAPLGSEAWNEILTYKADQVSPIPRDHIRILEDQLGYIFLGNYYAVTRDGGHTWFAWDANKELPVEQLMQQYNLWPAIQQIDLQANGSGRMILYPHLKGRERGPDLHTSDFGHHWTIHPTTIGNGKP